MRSVFFLQWPARLLLAHFSVVHKKKCRQSHTCNTKEDGIDINEGAKDMKLSTAGWCDKKKNRITDILGRLERVENLIDTLMKTN